MFGSPYLLFIFCLLVRVCLCQCACVCLLALSHCFLFRCIWRIRTFTVRFALHLVVPLSRCLCRTVKHFAFACNLFCFDNALSASQRSVDVCVDRAGKQNSSAVKIPTTNAVEEEVEKKAKATWGWRAFFLPVCQFLFIFICVLFRFCCCCRSCCCCCSCCWYFAQLFARVKFFALVLLVVVVPFAVLLLLLFFFFAVNASPFAANTNCVNRSNKWLTPFHSLSLFHSFHSFVACNSLIALSLSRSADRWRRKA